MRQFVAEVQRECDSRRIHDDGAPHALVTYSRDGGPLFAAEYFATGSEAREAWALAPLFGRDPVRVVDPSLRTVQIGARR